MAPRRNPTERMGPSELVSLTAGISETRAAWLLAQIGGLQGLFRAGVGELAEIIGDAPAVRLRAAVDLGQRMLEEVSKPRTPVLNNVEAVYQWSKARLVPLDHEEIWVLALDGRHQLRAAKMVARGGLSHVQVTTRDVLRFVLREGAVAFILAHNHPGGDPEPSREDLEFTRAIVEAGKNAGVPCIDHVIVARGGYVSMLERNMMPIAS